MNSPHLRFLDHDLGAYRNDVMFTVEDKIPGLEISVDTFMVDGKWASKCLFGIEGKDTSFFGKMVDFKSLPRQVKTIQEKMQDLYRSYGYCGFHGNEIRVGENKKYYLSDEANRFPAPPGELMVRMIDNYPEVIWLTASGETPDIKCENPYGAQLIIKSSWAEKDHTQPVYFPIEYEKNVFIKNLCIKQGVHNHVPIPGIQMLEIGAVAATDKTLKGAIKKVLEIAKEVKGYKIERDLDAFDGYSKEINKLNEVGIYTLTNG